MKKIFTLLLVALASVIATAQPQGMYPIKIAGEQFSVGATDTEITDQLTRSGVLKSGTVNITSLSF